MGGEQNFSNPFLKRNPMFKGRQLRTDPGEAEAKKDRSMTQTDFDARHGWLGGFGWFWREKNSKSQSYIPPSLSPATIFFLGGMGGLG